MKKYLAILITITILFSNLIVSAESDVKILINGENVVFTDDSGYPYVDENNRTMVPLRVTMETAGFVVGYDGAKQTAIVVTQYDRIEVPIGTNILYNNNVKIENDTQAVVKNGRTYLPIRAVLESAGFTVEWDAQLQTVNAYSFDFNGTDFSPYSTSSLATLIENILLGNVVYVNGQYYATPEYVKMLNTVQVHYDNPDINIALYPQSSRFDLADLEINTSEDVVIDDSWISEDDIGLYYEGYSFGIIPQGGEIFYGFTKSSPLSGTVTDKIIIDGLTSEFVGQENAEGTFDGIKIKVENYTVKFYSDDLSKVNFQ